MSFRYVLLGIQICSFSGRLWQSWHMWSDGLKLMRNCGAVAMSTFCSTIVNECHKSFACSTFVSVYKVRRLFAWAVWTVYITCLATILGVLQIPVDRSRLWDSLFPLVRPILQADRPTMRRTKRRVWTGLWATIMVMWTTADRLEFSLVSRGVQFGHRQRQSQCPSLAAAAAAAVSRGYDELDRIFFCNDAVMPWPACQTVGTHK